MTFGIEYGFLLPLNHFTKGHAYPQPDNGQPTNSYLPIELNNKKRNTPFYHETSVSANLVSDRWKITIGYLFSNLDIYGSARNLYMGSTHVEFEKKERGDEYLSALVIIYNNLRKFRVPQYPQMTIK